MRKVVVFLLGIMVFSLFSDISQQAYAATPLPSRVDTSQTTFAYRLFGGSDDPSRIVDSAIPKYRFFMLSPNFIQIATKIKSINPTAVVYMYKDATSTRRNLAESSSFWCTGDGKSVGKDWAIDYCDADTNHPDWFMKVGGSRFEYNSYPYHWHTDVGAAGYKETWASNTLADLQNNSVWDGVLIDNVLTDINTYTPGNVFPDQYADNASGQAAYKTFMDYVGTQLTNAGYGLAGNASGSRFHTGLWDQYTAESTGGYDEYWTTAGGTDVSPNNIGASLVGWHFQIAEAEAFTPLNKMLIASSQVGTNCNVCRTYAYASYLLINDGLHAYMEANGGQEMGDWVANSPMYTWQLGSATSAKTEIQGTNSFLFQRTYQKGLVLVNADYNNNRTVTLPEPYIDETGATVTSVNVNALRGRILRAVPDTTPPTAPTNLVQTAVNANSASFTWTASTDDEGLSGYIIYRDGVEVGTTNDSTTVFTDTGLDPATSYTYTVKAKDTSDNLSNASPPLVITTTTTGNTDTDGDGVTDDVEAAGPNNGDANNDTIQDNTQSNIVTFKNELTNSYNVLKLSGDCTAASNVTANTADLASLLDGRRNLTGALGFTATCPAAGQSATVQLYLDKLYTADTLKVQKLNPSLSSSNDITSDVTFSSAQIGGKTVTVASYHITDGGTLDTDGAANGSIVDPLVISQTAGLANTGQTLFGVIAAGSVLLITSAGLLVRRHRKKSWYRL